MSRFGQKGGPEEVKVWPIVNWVKKPENFSKMIRGHPCRGGTVHMTRFGQKDRPAEIKVWPIVNWVKKPENMSKMIRGALFWMFCSQYWVDLKKRHLSLITRSPLHRRHSSYESIRTEGSASRSKSLVYSKLSQKTWKFIKKDSGCTLSNFVQPILHCSK